MKRVFRILALWGLMLGALYVSNPGSKQFASHLQGYVASEINPGGDGQDLISRGLGKIAGEIGSEIAVRHNLAIFSVYQVDALKKRHTFLGIAGWFFLLGEPQALN
jgi:hypothetical protein